jgi:hypothetical protein
VPVAHRRCAVFAWPLAVVVAMLALSACGGAGRADDDSVSSSSGRLAATPGDYSLVRHSLVWMRQFSPESLMWQTVSVFNTGRGELTTLIGEISGAERRPFRISAGRLARLRRLLADSRRARIPPHHDLRATLYTLHVRGRPSVIIQGAIPRSMEPLIRFLTGLMSTYCC